MVLLFILIELSQSVFVHHQIWIPTVSWLIICCKRCQGKRLYVLYCFFYCSLHRFRVSLSLSCFSRGMGEWCVLLTLELGRGEPGLCHIPVSSSFELIKSGSQRTSNFQVGNPNQWGHSHWHCLTLTIPVPWSTEVHMRLRKRLQRKTHTSVLGTRYPPVAHYTPSHSHHPCFNRWKKSFSLNSALDLFLLTKIPLLLIFFYLLP